MSKTKLNIVNPDALFQKYGADSLRMYILFMGPPHKSTEYNDQGLIGMNRFIRRFYEYVIGHAGEITGIEPYSGDGSDLDRENRDLLGKLHRTIKKVTNDNENFAFNTGIAAIMECFNEMKSLDSPQLSVLRKAIDSLVLILYPMIPHLSEELWQATGHKPSAQYAGWPAFDKEIARAEEIEAVFQVNGKIRGREKVPSGTDDETLKKLALENEGIKRAIEGKVIKKVIAVRGKLVNIVSE